MLLLGCMIGECCLHYPQVRKSCHPHLVSATSAQCIFLIVLVLTLFLHYLTLESANSFTGKKFYYFFIIRGAVVSVEHGEHLTSFSHLKLAAACTEDVLPVTFFLTS